MDVTQLVGVAVTIGTIVAAIYGVIRFIDWRIERKIHEEPFLRKISASLRPVVIFDENSSILLDQGAMDVIGKIEVSRSTGGDKLPAEIVIYPKRHLTYAPLLQTLENELIGIVVSRGKGYEWRYQLEYQMSNDYYSGKRRFRLEVLQ
jgi:hypothetical protein